MKKACFDTSVLVAALLQQHPHHVRAFPRLLTVQRGLSSGAIYDALHLMGARAAQCDELLTFNGRHFEALAPGDALVAQP